jgi:hypothetical protein
MATAASNRSTAPEVARSAAPRLSVGLRWVVNAAMWLGAALVAASAVIHLHLWLTGYRNIPMIGPLFFTQTVVGFVLAIVLAWTRSVLIAVFSALFLTATIGGLLTSAWFGLFGFRDGFNAPYAGLSLFVEGAGVIVLGTGAALSWVGRRRAESPGEITAVARNP